MDQMTESLDQNAAEIVEFYNSLAPDYDLMTGFEQRFVLEKPFFRLLVDRYKITTALDAGCGTGFHSLLLSKLGVRVTATDISPSMIEQLTQHTTEHQSKVKIVRSRFQDLHLNVSSRFDAVFCLGNSLAHLLTGDELHRSLRNFHLLLQPGGTLILQNLNFDRIMKTRERIQSVTERSGVMFIRFYDFDAEFVQFNILCISKVNTKLAHRLASVQLRALLMENLLKQLTDTGFCDLHAFGGISLDRFDADASKDLVLIARKPL